MPWLARFEGCNSESEFLRVEQLIEIEEETRDHPVEVYVGNRVREEDGSNES